MGYTTEIEGQFNLNKELTKEHFDYLNAFSCSRRMSRDSKVVEGFDDPIRIAVGLPVGVDGEYYVGSASDDYGQGKDESVTDYNVPPSTQPGLWCQWVLTEDMTGFEWNGDEKFDNYVEWLNYIINNFLKPWGYVLSGEVLWRGEEFRDAGKIVVIDNTVNIKRVNF